MEYQAYHGVAVPVEHTIEGSYGYLYNRKNAPPYLLTFALPLPYLRLTALPWRESANESATGGDRVDIRVSATV